MKYIIVFTILFLFAQQGVSQTNNDKARAEYLNASDAYNSGDYKASVEGLKTAISLLGSTNVRIQDLMVKSYFGMKDYRQAKTEAEVYFSLNPPKDAGYDEILRLSGQIDELARKQQEKEAELNSWQLASSKNTKEGYADYLRDFPNGLHRSDAGNALEKLAWNETVKINTSEGYKKYLAEFPGGSHRKEAGDKIKEYEEDEQMRSDPDRFMEDAVKHHQYDLVMKLDDYGANLNVSYPDPDLGRRDHLTYLDSPLSIGRFISDTAERLSYVKSLLGHHADPATISKISDCGYQTFAIEDYIMEIFHETNTKFEILKLFLQSGLDINFKGGELLFILTIEHHGYSGTRRDIDISYIIEFLLQNNADPRLKIKHSCWSNKLSAFELAKRSNKSDLVELYKRYKK